MKVAVYLGSALNCLEEYNQLAYNVGKALAQAGHTVVYGGADVGTMKYLADGTMDAGGDIIGVFPSGFGGTKEVSDNGIKVERDGLTKMIYVPDFAVRKKTMEQISDCCLVLPGSFGTLDELFTYACNNAIGEHNGTAYILNYKGFYSPLKDLMENIRTSRMLKPETVAILQFRDSIEEVLAELR